MLFCGAVYAQAPQDAGSILRQQQTPPTVPPAQPAAVSSESEAGVSKSAAVPGSLSVQRFRFARNSRFNEAELNQALAHLTNRPLNFDQLSEALSGVQAYYRRHGFLARAFFPPQDVDNGVVLIEVIEARVGTIVSEPQGGGASGAGTSGRATDFITTRLAPGEPFDLNALGAATTILNEQPGVRARARLVQGKVAGETDVRLLVEEESKLTGVLEANTFGGRATGRLQTIVSTTAVNPFKRYDQIGAHVAVSEGLRFMRLEYALPLGSSGLRASVNLSSLDYRLTQDSLAALAGEGTARAWGAQLSMPLVRSDRLSVTGWFAGNTKLLSDGALGTTLKRVRTELVTVGLSASVVDAGGRPGATDLIIALGQGQSKPAGTIDLRGTSGSFTKLNWSVNRRQALTSKWSVSATLLGQLARKNLDSAERFALGGPYAVRAYPVGEATGDEAVLFKLNLLYAVRSGLTASVFLDVGQVKLNHSLYAGWNAANPNLRNRYSLAGAGVGIDYTAGQFTIAAALASQIGNNPGRDPSGRDADGIDSSVRGWLTARYAF